MSISVDYNKLETVTQFATFLDVLKDPTALKAMIDQAVQLMKDEKALMGPRSVMANAEAYRLKVEADLEQAKADFKKVQDDWTASVNVQKQAFSDEQARVSGLLEKAATDVVKAADDAKAAAKTLAAAQDQAADVAKQAAQLKLDQAALAEQEQVLADKAEQLAQLMKV